MKTNPCHTLAYRRQKAALFSALLVPAFIGTAQDKEDEVFELSPFVISAGDSDGYAARNTLAGTRIKTDLKDLGSAISVVTAEFLQDTGATGIDDLLVYTMGTEIGGPNGNFSGIDFGTDASTAITNDSAARIDSAQGARVRGIAKPNYTRNYFSTDVAIDSYNTGGITISRGANSLLFGLGSAAGVVDNSVKMPIIGQNKSEFSYRFGEHGSTRATVDLTRTLLDDRIAIKISGLHSDTKFTQKPAYNEEDRAYAAVNITLAKNENVSWLGRTSVRGNMEWGDSKGTPAKSTPPIVGYESFFLPPPDFYKYNELDFFAIGAPPGIGEPTKLFQSTWQSHYLYDTREQADGTPGYREAQTGAGDFPVYSTPFFFNPPVATIQANGTLSTGIPGSPQIAGFRTWANGDIVSSGKGADGVVRPENKIAYRPGIFIQTRAYEESSQGGGFRTGTLNNTDVFDYRNHLITGDIEKVNKSFNTKSVFFEQSLFEGKGGFEIAFDRQNQEQFDYLPFGGGARNSPLYIDTTMYLPDGTLNPNAGKVFASTTGSRERENTRLRERNNKRGTAFYELDFNDYGDRLGRIFGKHNFTGLLQSEDLDWKTYSTGAYISAVSPDPLKQLQPTNFDPISGNVQFSSMYYLTDSPVTLQNAQTLDDVRLTQINSGHMLQPGDQYDIQFYTYKSTPPTTFATVNNPTGSNIGTATFQYNRLYDNVNVGRTNIESKAFAWQSYLFNNHIVGLFGRREDEVKEWGRVRINPVTGEPILNANGTYNTTAMRLDNNNIQREIDINSVAALNGKTDPIGRTTTWSVVGHLPQKFLQNSWINSVSAHYAASENFDAGQSGFNHEGEFVPAPQGDTVEMGITIGFAEDKWNLRLNRFESKQKYKSADSASGAIAQGRDRPLSNLNAWYDAFQNSSEYIYNLAANGMVKNPNWNPGLEFAKMVRQLDSAGNVRVDGSGSPILVPNINPNIVEAIDYGFTSYQHLLDTLMKIVPTDIAQRYNYALNDSQTDFISRGEGISDLKAVQDLVSKGYELEVTGNPTKNLRITMNLAKVEAIPTNSAVELGNYAAAVLKNIEDLGLTYVNETPSGGIVDIGQRWRENVFSRVLSQQSMDGHPIPELREYRFNAIGNYKFTEGRFKGFSVGGAYRYQSAVQTGTGIYVTPDKYVFPDLNNVYEGKALSNVDTWFRYNRKLWNDKVNWSVQLNVRNVLGSEKDIVVFTNPDGVDRIYRVAPDVRSWFVNNTFSF